MFHLAGATLGRQMMPIQPFLLLTHIIICITFSRYKTTGDGLAHTPTCRGEVILACIDRSDIHMQLHFFDMGKRLSQLALALALWTVGATGTSQANEPPQTQLPRARIQAGMHIIDAQVAQTPPQLEKGLMHRQSMPTNEGMLFVFPDKQQRCFWMKNTLIPLTIAFLADDGTVLQTEDMQAGSLASHCSKHAVRYALEMNLGWFKQRGFQPGDRLQMK
jgi:uncharacterized membrane protein (UPF0127 family)